MLHCLADLNEQLQPLADREPLLIAEFVDGDTITIDPDRTPVNGCFVIAKDGEKTTFKQLVIDGASVFLKPLNSRYPVKDMTGVDFQVIGVVVNKEKRYC